MSRCLSLTLRHRRLYVDLLGMTVGGDSGDNVYLTSGNDNLALHRVSGDGSSGQLDHIGFYRRTSQVDEWYPSSRSKT